MKGRLRSKIELGILGENISQGYLLRSGFNIVSRNCRFGHLEVDIIASLGERLVFFEVKTRSGECLGADEENLKKRQIKNLKKAISFYCYSKNINIEKARLDFLIVIVDELRGVAKIRHYKDILF